MDKQHPDLHIEEFAEQREALIKTMKDLDASWDGRVLEFMVRVKKHFN